jgi:hypothetical protein
MLREQSRASVAMVFEYGSEFRFRLEETIRWCAGRADARHPEGSLRSRTLQPALGEHDGDLGGLWLRTDLIRQVVRKRHDAVAMSPFGEVPGKPGRLLASAYEYTNFNGATATATDSFFDDMDVPPWDTWVDEIPGLPGSDAMGTWGSTWPPTLESYLGGELNTGLLIAWIPSAFVPLVDRAIDVECIGMLRWVTSPAPPSDVAPRFDRVLPAWLVLIAVEMETSGPMLA